jgi:tetratricopeptide (TPR) repeat protein
MALCWSLAMVAALSYPVFLFYISSLFLVLLWRFHQKTRDLRSPGKYYYILAAMGGLLLPLAAAFIVLRAPSAIVYDPTTTTGLFRGGGRFSLDPGVWVHATALVFRDLFVKGVSYYYEVSHPDFSGVLAMTGLGWLVGTVIFLCWTGKAVRPVLLAALLLLAINLLVPNFSLNGGIRRCTGIIAAYFVLFAVVWNFYLNTPFKNPWLRRAGIFLCLLLPAASLLKFPPLLAGLRQPGKYRDDGWFAVAGSPSESLRYFVEKSGQGGRKLSLSRLGKDGQPVACRYSEIYAAVAGYRLWNGLPAAEIRGWDWQTKKMVTLAPLPGARLAGENPYVQESLGLALSAQGDLDGALAHFRAAVQLEPYWAIPRCRLASVLYRMGRTAEAIQEYQTALQYEPDSTDTHNALGLALGSQGRLAEAAAQFRAALALTPDDAELHCDLGNALAGQGQYPEAIREYEEALRLKPNYAHAENNLATALDSAGRPEEALAYYQAALRLEPEAAATYCNLGELLVKLGRRDEAVAQFKEALRLQPDNPEARAQLEKLTAPAPH